MSPNFSVFVGLALVALSIFLPDYQQLLIILGVFFIGWGFLRKPSKGTQQPEVTPVTKTLPVPESPKPAMIGSIKDIQQISQFKSRYSQEWKLYVQKFQELSFSDMDSILTAARSAAKKESINIADYDVNAEYQQTLCTYPSIDLAILNGIWKDVGATVKLDMAKHIASNVKHSNEPIDNLEFSLAYNRIPNDEDSPLRVVTIKIARKKQDVYVRYYWNEHVYN